jgi:hypothetical protein
MMLPELSPKAAPEFIDPAECKAWLEHVPLANVGTAQQDLIVQLEEFNRLRTDAANRLAVAETLREAVHFVQLEQAKRFTNRALPMAPAESAAFEDTIELWDQMRIAYAHCIEAALRGEADIRPQAALVCQRALAYSGLRMFHHFRAYREVPPEDWRELHEAFRASETLRVVEGAVKDFTNRDVHDTSPRVAYARAVLMGMCNPNELSQRQLTFVAYLLERWGTKLEVLHEPADEGLGVPPIVADLASGRCPERPDPESHGKPKEPRYLDARKLAKSLRNRVGLLRKGESPAKLALGEDCVQPSCEQLLVFLYRQWCQPKPPRSADRRRAAQSAELCSGMAAVHYYVTGQAFREPSADQQELSKKQREEIATFGRVSTREEDDYSQAHGFALEGWKISDETAQGLRVVRTMGTPGRRHSHGELVALRPSDAKGFLLGQLRWLLAAENGDLHAGIKLLPGLPGGAAARPTGVNQQADKFVPVLTLGAVQALNSPRSLVLPPGWYKPERIIELHAEATMRVRLTGLVERGWDFERVTFEAER